MKIKTIIAIVVVVTTVIIGLTIFRTNRTNRTYSVNRVIDGDTLVIDNNQEIRLANVDAPELGRCGADEAKSELEKMVLNNKIKIEGDVNDKFGRLLTTAWIGEKMLNEEMAKSGWVRYISQGEHKQIAKIDDEAEKNKLGIYGKCVETTNLKNPNCLIKGNNNENGDKIYFLPKCKGYTNTVIATDQGDQWFCSEAEAVEAGYKKALNCML